MNVPLRRLPLRPRRPRRRARASTSRAHIPGAVFLDLEPDLSDSRSRRRSAGATRCRRRRSSRPRPRAPGSARACSRRLRRTCGRRALWWLLRHFGHDDAAADRRLGAARAARSGEEHAEPAEFVPRERTDDMTGADELAARLATQLVAPRRARTPSAGAASASRSTRSPAASPAPSTPEPTGRLTELPPLARRRELVAYCGSGVAACACSSLDRPAAPTPASTPAPGATGSPHDLPIEKG